MIILDNIKSAEGEIQVIDVRDEAKRLLGIRTDIAGAYTESDRARIDGIILLCSRVRAEEEARAKILEDGLIKIAIIGCECDTEDPDGLAGEERCKPHLAQDALTTYRASKAKVCTCKMIGVGEGRGKLIIGCPEHDPDWQLANKGVL